MPKDVLSVVLALIAAGIVLILTLHNLGQAFEWFVSKAKKAKPLAIWFCKGYSMLSPVVFIGIGMLAGGLIGGSIWLWLKTQPSGDSVQKADHPKAPLPVSIPVEPPAQKKKTGMPQKSPKSVKNQKIEVGSNSVVSINQQGGITAHTVNITGLPEARCEVIPVASNVPDGELYKTEFRLVLHPDGAVVPNLHLEIHAPTIQKVPNGRALDITPQRSGGMISGHTGIRPGYVFTNITNAGGSYLVRVYSKNPEQFGINCETN